MFFVNLLAETRDFSPKWKLLSAIKSCLIHYLDEYIQIHTKIVIRDHLQKILGKDHLKI